DGGAAGAVLPRQLALRVLRPRGWAPRPDGGSCQAAIEGRDTHLGQRGGGLPALQPPQGQPVAVRGGHVPPKRAQAAGHGAGGLGRPADAPAPAPVRGAVAQGARSRSLTAPPTTRNGAAPISPRLPSQQLESNTPRA